jgi:hypothetical protein
MVIAEAGFYRKAQKLCPVMLYNCTRYNRIKYAWQTTTRATANQHTLSTKKKLCSRIRNLIIKLKKDSGE